MLIRAYPVLLLVNIPWLVCRAGRRFVGYNVSPRRSLRLPAQPSCSWDPARPLLAFVFCFHPLNPTKPPVFVCSHYPYKRHQQLVR